MIFRLLRNGVIVASLLYGWQLYTNPEQAGQRIEKVKEKLQQKLSKEDEEKQKSDGLFKNRPFRILPRKEEVDKQPMFGRGWLSGS